MASMQESVMSAPVLAMYRATKRAGLPAHLITAMLGVARSTLYSWYAGVTPNKAYLQKLRLLAKVSDLAVSRDLLPAPPSILDDRWKEALALHVDMMKK